MTMKRTQRLIVILGESSLIDMVSNTLSGFHACTRIKSISDEILDTVYSYNKNALYFATVYEMTWSKYNPIIIRLSTGNSDISSAILGTNDIIKDFPKIMDLYDIDVGDHKTEDSGNLVSTETCNCLLCNIYNRTTEKPEHILYETNSFFVVPGTGAFFPGYLMIVPKRHIMSFAWLTPEELDEFFTVLNDIRSILEAIYGSRVLAFEAGSKDDGAGKHVTSIVHAHFHLAPVDMPLLKEVRRSGITPALIKKQDITQYGKYHYLLYVDHDDNWFIANDPHCYFPRQHFRQVLAEYLGCYEFYNWRIYPYRDRMDVIADEFRTFCRKNIDTLPKWVQKSIRFED